MKRKTHLAVFVSYSALVAVLSLLPKSSAISVSNDKVGHLLAYSVFAILAHRLYRTARPYFIVCIGILFYGALLEVGQYFVPGREMSALDIVANASGVVLGALISTGVSYYLRRSPGC